VRGRAGGRSRSCRARVDGSGRGEGRGGIRADYVSARQAVIRGCWWAVRRGTWTCGWQLSSEPRWRCPTTWPGQDRTDDIGGLLHSKPTPHRGDRGDRASAASGAPDSRTPMLGQPASCVLWQGTQGWHEPHASASALSAIHQHAHLDRSWLPDGEHRNSNAALNVVGLRPLSEVLVWYMQACVRQHWTFSNQETSEP